MNNYMRALLRLSTAYVASRIGLALTQAGELLDARGQRFTRWALQKADIDGDLLRWGVLEPNGWRYYATPDEARDCVLSWGLVSPVHHFAHPLGADLQDTIDADSEVAFRHG